MKLRLPRQFQAALMAAIASVSLTTLSTGTSAYAATSSLEDAELQLVDFTAETMTRVGSEGWTLDVNGTAFTGDASGIYTSTSNIARIDSDHNWAGVASYSGNRTLWAGIITIDVNSLKNPAIAKASLIQDATGTSSGDRLEGVGFGTSGGQKYIDGAWKDNPLWGESNNMRIGTPLETYADANGLVTIAVIYVGDGTNSTRILVGDQTATGSGLRGGNNMPNLPIFLADAAGVKYSNVFLFGLQNNSELSVATMQGMMKDAGAYYWQGGTNGNWDATSKNWTHYGSDLAVSIGTNGGNANTNVVFGADAAQKNVTLAGAATVGDMTVEGAGYAFNVVNGATLTVTGNASIGSTIALNGGTLSLNNVMVTGPFTSFDAYDDSQGAYYSKGTSGFLTRDYLGYLVKGGEGAQGASISGSVTGAEKTTGYGTSGDIIVKFAKGSDTIYYVNEVMSYAADMDPATDFVIKKGAMLSATGTGAYTTAKVLHGEGTYALAGGASTLNSGLTIGPDWTGAVRLSGQMANLNINTLGTNIASTIEFAGVAGNQMYFADHGTGIQTLSRDVIFTNANNTSALKLNDGFSRNGAYEFAGNVSGHGTFELDKAGVTYHFIFSGDVSGWDGQFKVTHSSDGTGTGRTWVKFAGDAQEVNATINNVGGFLRVIADTDAAFSKTITASEFEVTAGHTATLKETLTLTGDLTLDGSATLEKGGSVGTIDLSHSGNAHGTLTLNAGQTLTYSNSFWGANNNKLLLGEGATVKQASNAPIEIVGLAGESYVSSSANAQFGLTASAYTLHNVQATIKTASSDVQLRFDNSKLVTDQSITLKNLQSVFSGMDIQGGTTTMGASDATGTVQLGAVTLSGGKLALAEHVTGSVSSIDVTGSSAISGGTLSMGGTITTQENAQLTLGGTVLFADGGIATSGTGTLAFGDGVMFNLSQLTEGENHTFTLFTGNAVDLTGLNAAAADHITGVITTGRTWSFTNDGKLTYTVNSRDLTWSYSVASGIWTAESESEMPWEVAGVYPPERTYFSNGDSVTFGYSMEPVTATLESDITAATMVLDTEANVTVINDGTHSFSVEELDIKSGHLTTNTAVTVKSVKIASGAEWALGGALDLDTVTTFSNNGVLRVLNGVQLRVHKSNAESYGTVTADAGGTLYVDNGSGQGDAKYTYHGSADAPFKGTLVYDVVSGNSHDNTIALENFQGTLELRGRLAASTCDFGGMTKLVLNGDRSSNTTGMWNQNAFTLDVPVDIVGESTVDLFTSAAMTINGAVNGGTEKRGHLGKQNTGTLTFGGAVALIDFTTAGGSVTFNAGATMDAMTINGGTVTLNGGGSLGDMHLAGGSASVTLGGADKDYSFNSVKISSGNLSVAESGVNSLTAGDLVVRTNSTLSSAAANPTVFNVTNFDVSNYDTNFTLRNVTLNVSGEATAAVLNTGQNVDQATVTVDDKATLNLDGSVVWKKVDEKDATKTDYVNLTIANGGEAHVNGGEHNILNNVTLNHGGSLSFGTGTTTTVAGTLALADTITNAGTVTINGGSVAAGQAGTLTGSGTYNLNGTITNNGTLQLADATFNGAAGAAITGNVAIHGALFSGSLAIGSSGSTISVTKAFTVEKGASLNLSGADALILDNLEGTVATYSDGVEDPTNNGFLVSLTGTVFHYLDDSEPEVICPTLVTYHGVEGRIWPFNGEGVFTIGGSKATFYVNTATETEETYSHAKAVGADTFTMVELANGTGFNIDSANAALSRVTVKAGAAASLTIGGTGATIGSVETGNGLSLTGEGTLTLGNAGGDHSLNGAGTLTINGPTVTINGTNNASFTGNIDVLAGTLKLGDSTGDKYVLGAYNYTAGDTRTITIHTGATLDINGKADANYVLTLDGGRFTNNSNTDVAVGSSQVVGLKLTANSYVGDSGHGSEFWLRERTNKPTPILELNQYNLTKQGTGVFGLHSTTVTGTGYLVVEEGTVKFDGGSFGANLRMAGGAVTGTVNLTENTTIDATEGTTSTFAAVIAGTGKSVTKTGEGTLTLTGANTYTGGTTISAGTVKTANDAALSTGNVIVEANGTLDVTGKLIIGGQTANQGGSLTINAGTLALEDGAALELYAGTGGRTYGLGNVEVTGTASIMNRWNDATLNVASIQGGASDSLALISNHCSSRSIWNIGTADAGDASFKGTLELQSADTDGDNGRNVDYNFKDGGMFSSATLALKDGAYKTTKTDKSMNNNIILADSEVKFGGINDLPREGSNTRPAAWTIKSADSEDRTLVLDAESGSYTTKAGIDAHVNVQKTGASEQTFSGSTENFNGSIDVEGGVLNIMNAASVNVTDVTISNSTMGVYTGDTAEEESVGTLTITEGHKLTGAGEAAKLNANLVMNAGSTLDVSDYGGVGGLHMGCSVTLNPGMSLSTQDMEGVAGLGFMEAYDLHYDVESFFIGDTRYTEITFASETWVNAAEVFTNPEFSTSGKDYYVFYSGTSAGGNGGNVGTVYIVQVPEPTTGTLSLLALCALAARRRRK